MAGPVPDPAVSGSVRAIPGCNQAPSSGQIHNLDELLAWPAAELAKLTCADLERALPGTKAPTLTAFETALSSDQRAVYSTKIISPDVKLSSNSLLADFTAGVDSIGKNIGNALGLGGLLTGVLSVVLYAVFVLGGLGIIAMGLNRLTGGAVTRAGDTATKGAALAAVV